MMSNDDDDDDLLLATTAFSFRKRPRVSSVLGSEDDEAKPVSSLALKDILGEDPEKEALLASEGFWEKFGQPTQEQLLLKVEQDELRNLQGSDEEEEEEEVQICYSCQIRVEKKQQEAEDDDLLEERLESLLLFFPFQISSAASLESLMVSSIFPDLLGSADLADSTRKRLFETLIQMTLTTSNPRLLACLRNCAFGLIRRENFSFSYSEELLQDWLANFGLSTRINNTTDGVSSTNDEPVATPVSSLKFLLEYLEEDLRCNIGRFSQDEASMIFRAFVPLLFDPALAELKPSVTSLLQACIAWIPVCMAEKLVSWFEGPLGTFLTSPVKRLVVLLRAISGSDKAVLGLLPILDHFISQLIAQQQEQEKQSDDADSNFVHSLLTYLEEENRDVERRSLAKVSRILELASLRLVLTSVEDLGTDQLEHLKRTLKDTKESIPTHPTLHNLKCIDLLGKMYIHLETFFRSKGVGLHKAGLITHHFKTAQ